MERPPMTDEIMNVRSLVEKSADANLLREMIGFAAERLMELEIGSATGAGYGEKTPMRLAQRNGYRDGDWRRGLERSSFASRSCAKVAISRAFWSRVAWRAWHGHLPDSFRERPMLRPSPRIVMRRQLLPAILPKYAGWRVRRAGPAGCASIHSRIGRTSTPGLQRADQKKRQKGCNGK